MSENNVMVHSIPFLIQPVRLMLFFFNLHHNCCIFFSILKAWFTRRQTLSCCLFLLTCVMQTNQTQHVTCNMTVFPAPGTFSAFVRVWYIFLHKFYTLAVEVYVAVCYSMLQYVAVLLLYFNLCIAVNISLVHHSLRNFLCKISHFCLISMHRTIFNNCDF